MTGVRHLAWRDYPAKLRTDNDPEFISVALAERAEQRCIALEFIKPGTPTQNSYVGSSIELTGTRF